MKNFKIYRSSAGSGKTNTLALEFLQIALSSMTAYRNILAVTFTNKATREMKERIISFLDELSRGVTNHVSDTLQENLGIDHQTLMERSKQLKTVLLHGYSFFSVHTIDTFFQKVIRAFAREMGLQAGFNLELDTGKVLDELIDKIYTEVGRDKQLTQWLIQFATSKVESGKSWDFREDLKSLGNELFKEEFKTQVEPYLLGHNFREHIQNILSKAQQIQGIFENTMAGEGKAAMNIINNYGLSVDSFAHQNSGVAGYLQKLALKKDFVPGARPRQALDNPEKWYTKKSPQKDTIEEAVNNGLNDHLKNALEFYDAKAREYFTALEILKNIYTYGIFTHLLALLEQYRHENDVMLITDAPVFLHGIIDKEETPFIYEKIGAQYQHFLIDEFQDTSSFQWENFKPLIQNSIDGGNTSLVVGDLKQSIYRFRGGDWRLLQDQVQKDIPEELTALYHLDNNFRSNYNVVAFNNSLFEKIPEIIRNNLIENIRQTDASGDLIDYFSPKIDMLAQAYEDVKQQHSKSETREGLVNITFHKNDKTKDGLSWKELALAQLPGLIESLQDQNIALRDMAILVRKTGEGKEIADYLMQYKQSEKAKPNYRYDIVSSEALYLQNSRAISLLVNAMKFLEDPNDQIVCSNFLFDYFQIKNPGNQPVESFHEIFYQQKDILDQLPESFSNHQEWLSKLPVYELAEQLIGIFDLGNDTITGAEKAYLQAFQDQLLDFSKKETGDIHSFIAWWEENGYQTSVLIPEAMDAIRILTVHKAKGLQYKIVIIPFCDWLLPPDSRQNNILWSQASHQKFSDLGPLPINYSDHLASTYFDTSYFEEMVNANIDNINLLYVAFTRAIKGLYAMAPLPENQKMKYVSQLLYEAVTSEENHERESQITGQYPTISLPEYWDSEKQSFTFGEGPQELPKTMDGDSSPNKQENVSLSNYPTHSWQARLSIRQNAADFFRVKSDDDSGNREQQSLNKINHGLLVHDLLARIIYKDQLDEKLHEIYFERGLNNEDLIYLRNKMEALFAKEEIRQWFEEHWQPSQIKTEMPILTKEGKLYRPDRVIIDQNRLTILEFKTGIKSKDHHYQIKSYERLFENMGYKKVDGFILYIDEEELVGV